MTIQEYQLSEKVRGKLNKSSGKDIEVINDLTTGGVDSALSAEQGRVIKAFIDKHGADIAKNAKDILDEIGRKATKTTLGNVMVDDKTIKVDENGVISSVGDSGSNVVIVDDLTTGGRDSALSAEQGKIINDFVQAETLKLVDIYDGLDSDTQNKVLPASQGKALKKMIDDLELNTATKYTEIDDGYTGVNILTEEFPLPVGIGTWFELSLNDALENSRALDVDVSIIPRAFPSYGVVSPQFKLSISMEKSDSGEIVSAFYTSDNPLFEAYNLQVWFARHSSTQKEKILISLKKNDSMFKGTTMYMCAVDKLTIKGTGGSSALLEELKNVSYRLVTDTDLDSTVIKYFEPLGRLTTQDLMEVSQQDLFIKNKLPSGVYSSQVSGLSDKGLPDGRYIFKLHCSYDEFDTVARTWVAEKVVIDNNQTPPNIVADWTDTYHCIDFVEANVIIASSPWKKYYSKTDMDKVQSDIQSLFTGWANETKNAVTALAHKGVTLSQDATMKQVVSGIESISNTKQVREFSNVAPVGQKSFNYVGSSSTSLYYITLDITALGFKPLVIFIENKSFNGQGTTVKVDSGSVLSARVVDASVGYNTGSNKWIRLGGSGFPTTGKLDIPVSSLDAYNMIVHEA